MKIHAARLLKSGVANCTHWAAATRPLWPGSRVNIYGTDLGAGCAWLRCPSLVQAAVPARQDVGGLALSARHLAVEIKHGWATPWGGGWCSIAGASTVRSGGSGAADPDAQTIWAAQNANTAGRKLIGPPQGRRPYSARLH